METKLDKAVKVLSKLAEAAHWIGAVGCVVGLVLTFVMGSKAVVIAPENYGAAMKVYSLEILLTDAAGNLNMALVRCFLVGAVLLLGLMAMVFRNIHLIVKNSQGTTPFQPDNVRMVREIGIFLIAQPVVALIMGVVARLAAGVDLVEASVDMGSVVIGLVVLCLSRIFARGMELEKDMDGLL